MTVKELCDRYKAAVDKGLIMGKRGLPKKPLTDSLSIWAGSIATSSRCWEPGGSVTSRRWISHGSFVT